MRQIVANLKFWQKFAVVGALALGMAGLPAWLVLSNDLDTLQTAKAEQSGLAPAKALIGVMRLAQQHRGMSARQLSGDESATAARASKQPEIDAAFDQVIAALSTYGDEKLSAKAHALRDEWKSLAGAVAARSLDGATSFARHSTLIQGLQDLLEDVSDSSTLALDPESSSYHLIIAVVNHLPPLAESMARMGDAGGALLARGDAKPEERASLQALASVVELHSRDAHRALSTASDADPALKPALDATADEALKKMQGALSTTREQIVKADKLDVAAPQYAATMTGAVDAQFKVVEAAAAALESMLQQRVADTQGHMTWIAALVVLMGALECWILVGVARATGDSVNQALTLARNVARGDLTARIDSTDRDELGQLLRELGRMSENLSSIVHAVRAGSESIATGSSEIATGNADLSQRTEEQASNLQQTASSMEQLSGTVNQTAESARQATALAADTSSVAVRGGDVVSQVVSTMAEISTSSHKIADIIGVIDGIAFQTNILALNAAVEAARAGEQGRGFAVVASEVRSLAKRSAEAAREIKRLIGASVDRIESGSHLVGEAGATMTQVVSQVQKVAALISGISAATADQTAGINLVGDSVTELDRVTQQNAALVEESAAASASLKEQADSLIRAVDVFKLREER